MDSEFYEKDGKKFDRVTKILGYFQAPELVDWKLRVGKKEANRISKVAIKRGTSVDEAIRRHVSGEKIPKFKTIEEENCFKAYLQWRKDYGIEKIESATTMFDDDAMIAGTPDLWIQDTTVDIKCAKSIKQNYWLQTEWYARRKGHHFKAILRLDPDLSHYEYKKIPVDEYHLRVFEALVTAFRFYNKTVNDGEEEV